MLLYCFSGRLLNKPLAERKNKTRVILLPNHSLTAVILNSQEVISALPAALVQVIRTEKCSVFPHITSDSKIEVCCLTGTNQSRIQHVNVCVGL